MPFMPFMPWPTFICTWQQHVELSMYAGQHFCASIKRRAISVKTTLYGCHATQAAIHSIYTMCPHKRNQDSGSSPVQAADMSLAEEVGLLMEDAARAGSDLCTEELGAHSGQFGQEAGPAGPGPGPAAGPEPSLQRSLRPGPCLAGHSACQSRWCE